MLCITLAILVFGLLIRFPTSSGLREAGADGSYYVALARIVVDYGRAPWTVDPLSYFGLFPYSEGVATPFLVATVHALSGLEVPLSALFFTFAVTLAGALGVFLCLVRTTRSGIAAAIGAFAFLTAPILLLYSDQALISRFVEVCWIPFVMLAFVERKRWRLHQTAPILTLLILLVLSTHLSFILIIALFLGVALLEMIDTAWRILRPSVMTKRFLRTLSRHYYVSFLIACGLAVAAVSLVPFSGGGEGPGLGSYDIGVFPGNSIVSSLGNLLVSTGGGAGIVAVAFVLAAPRKWTLAGRSTSLPVLAALLVVLALAGFRLYSRPLVAAVLAIAAGVGVVSVLELKVLAVSRMRRRVAATAIIVLMLGGTVVSGIVAERWTAAETYTVTNADYSAFVYVRAETSGNMFCNHYPTDRFLTADTGDLCSPDLPGSALEMVPFISSAYSWASLVVNPRSLAGITNSTEGFGIYDVSGYNPYANYFRLTDSSLSANAAALERYDIHYALEYRPFSGEYAVRWYGDRPLPSKFLTSLTSQAYITYQNEDYSLWYV